MEGEGGGILVLYLLLTACYSHAFCLHLSSMVACTAAYKLGVVCCVPPFNLYHCVLCVCDCVALCRVVFQGEENHSTSPSPPHLTSSQL